MIRPKVTAHVAATLEERDAWMGHRHRFFCLGEASADGKSLELCRHAASPTVPHDDWDRQLHSVYFSATTHHVDGPIAISRLIIAGKPEVLPTGAILNRLPTQLIIDPTGHYVEPSRSGIHRAFHRKRLGLEAMLRVTGKQIECAVELGFTHYVVMLLPDMLDAFNWFPWQLGEPIRYPASEGGPKLPVACYAATVRLADVAAMARLQKPWIAEAMFPDGTEAWAAVDDPLRSDQLEAIVQANKAKVAMVKAGLEDGSYRLPELLPATPRAS